MGFGNLRWIWNEIGHEEVFAARRRDNQALEANCFRRAGPQVNVLRGREGVGGGTVYRRR